MKRVLIIVSGGVADYVADDGVEVTIFDEDNFVCEDAKQKQRIKEDLEGFEYLIPEWINDLIND